MERIAVFPGTFDPITLGHLDVIERALPLFDRIYVGIGINAQKITLFSLAERKRWIKELFEKEEKVEVKSYEGLTTDFCKKMNARFILRGVRTVKDFEYEKTIADMNTQLLENIETVLLFSSSKYSTLASTLVRDVYRNGGDVSGFLPDIVIEDLSEKKEIEI